MKSALKISILANIGLVLLVAWLIPRVRVAGQNPAPSAALPETNRQISEPVAAQSPVPAESQPRFQWRSLESADYRTYIANLKAIGCPHQTIRDIITADVDGLYASRRAELLQQGSTGPVIARANAQQALAAKMNALYSEEASVLAALLGSPPASATVATENAEPPAWVERKEYADAPPSVPLVFQNIDPTALGLNAEQANDVAYLRQRFQEQIGGPNQDPNDPAYFQRWQAAQPENDLMLRSLLGAKVFDQLEDAAGSQSPPSQ